MLKTSDMPSSSLVFRSTAKAVDFDKAYRIGLLKLGLVGLGRGLA